MCCDPDPVRRRIRVTGVVQGVGYRPFVVRLAHVHDLSGFVKNDPAGVYIEAEGDADAVAAFTEGLTELAPPMAHIIDVASRTIPFLGTSGFAVGKSDAVGPVTTIIPPDADVCDACLAELFDPADRRYRYPFINCTDCGPRFTLITALPYDRPNTTMASFPLCPDCRREYEDETDRRFHAEPIACPVCGPQVTLRDETFTPVAVTDPVAETVRLLGEGTIVAIKGIGGYHLACRADDAGAVTRLRLRKGRDRKPFALMAADATTLRRYVVTDPRSLALAQSRPRPITLLPKIDAALLPGVAPGATTFGVMLPYAPLHHLLFVDAPYETLVMTSANITDEPIAYDDADAGERLAGVADYFLSNDRPIRARADDSVERMMAHGPVVIRRSRGYAPVPVRLDRAYPTTLGVGGELKNCYCVIKGNLAYLGPHVGDLKYEKVYDAYREGIERFLALLGVDRVDAVGYDKHPAYLSTRFAREFADARGATPVAVQHHHAHLVSLMAERNLDPAAPIVGVVFDGTGYGDDGTIWGGEFLVGDADGFDRAAALAPLALPGGDAAVKEPWRIAVALLAELFGDDLPPLPWLTDLPDASIALVRRMAARRLNTPLSHGVGRHFDCMAALLGMVGRVSYEGEGAIGLEMAVAPGDHGRYPVNNEAEALDLALAYRAAIDDMLAGVAVGVVAARFHATIIEATADRVERIRRERGIMAVGLTGGVFQNRIVAEGIAARLRPGGPVALHSRIPPNDGGLALGQALAAARSIAS